MEHSDKLNPADVVTYRWQWCRGDADITADPFAESDATEARAWSGAHGDGLLLAVARKPGGRWRAVSSDGDLSQVEGSSYDSPGEALTDLFAGRIVEAVCRCGSGGECD